LWVNAGEECGWGADPTLDVQILNILDSEPRWADYTESNNVARFKQLYNFNASTNIVTGTLASTYATKDWLGIPNKFQVLNYGRQKISDLFNFTISHNFRSDLIADFEYDKLFTLKNIQYINNVDDLKVDI
jgi:hypothetical protein